MVKQTVSKDSTVRGCASHQSQQIAQRWRKGRREAAAATHSNPTRGNEFELTIVSINCVLEQISTRTSPSTDETSGATGGRPDKHRSRANFIYRERHHIAGLFQTMAMIAQHNEKMNQVRELSCRDSVVRPRPPQARKTGTEEITE